jgi:uncharacterized membrane protein
MSYIDANDVSLLCAVLFSMTWIGFLADTSKLGRTIPGVVWILTLGCLLSNLHVTPFSSSVTGFIHQYVVAAAIPLLMIKADLRRIFIESGRVMLAFGAACIGIVLGVFIGFYLLQPWHVGAKVAGMYAGAFIGGTISMVAVANAVQMTSTELSAATGASMIPSVLGLMALVALPTFKFVQRHMPAPRIAASAVGEPALQSQGAVPEFRLTHITGALALTLCICAAARIVSHWVTGLTGHDQAPYYILYVTVLTVVVANVFPKPLRTLRGEFELGMIFMYMFFAAIGLGTDVTSFLDRALSLFFYVVILLGFGIVITMILCKLLKLDLAEAVTGCGAAIVGPAATVAVVAGKGWYAMVSPAVMTGILCHVVGNFIGVTVATLLL